MKWGIFASNFARQALTIPESNPLDKKTPKKSPKHPRRRTLKKASPLTPDGFYNQYLNPRRYR